MAIGRRKFVQLSTGMLAAIAVPGCASVMVTRVRPSNGTVRLQLGDFPQLARAGGHLRIQIEESATPIYVLALADGGFAAVSPICTHLGCTVDIAGEWLVCPCHGSTYERTGSVVRGPAERPLGQYPVATSGGELIIQVGEQR
ncbi:MAG: Rieske (2Fe-2S) protein [Gemmatimonadota bacterium]